MKCTVLGGKGYIGRNLVSYLRSLGNDVTVPEPNDFFSTTESLGVVFYCIGITADFRTRPYDTVRSHITMLSEFLERVKFEKIIYLSSTRIYNSDSSGDEESSFTVNPANNSDLYNISKLMGESLCLTSNQDKARIVRLSNVVGRQDIDSKNFLAALRREAMSGKILLQADLTSSKDYIYIDDAIEIISKIAFNSHRNIYNVASGQQITHAQVVDLLIKISGCMVEVIKNADKIIFPPINIERIKIDFNFKSRPVLEMFSSLKDL